MFRRNKPKLVEENFVELFMHVKGTRHCCVAKHDTLRGYIILIHVRSEDKDVYLKCLEIVGKKLNVKTKAFLFWHKPNIWLHLDGVLESLSPSSLIQKLWSNITNEYKIVGFFQVKALVTSSNLLATVACMSVSNVKERNPRQISWH